MGQLNRGVWRMTQSAANHSPKGISLLSGKNTGKLLIFEVDPGAGQLKAREITALFERIP
jgi:hypothetical protein